MVIIHTKASLGRKWTAIAPLISRAYGARPTVDA